MGGLSLLPRFEERIAPEFYSFSGKLRVFAVVGMMIVNYGGSTQVAKLGIDEDYYWWHLWMQTPLWLLDVALGMVIWRGKLSVKALRALTIVCLLIECGTLLSSIQAYGSVNSHMVSFTLLVVMVYRLSFDFTIGVIALIAMVGGLWGIVIAETQGWIAPQPIAGGTPDGIYAMAGREMAGLYVLTMVIVITFVMANWGVARLRHKEIAVKMLRDALYAQDAAKLGRHTGRLLKNTYRVGGLLGTGGMGEVYSGHHQRTQRAVAIKLLHPHLIEDPALLRRFRREAEVTGRLGSEHIVDILDIDEDDGQPFIVLELLEGQSLAARLRDGALPSHDEVADVVEQLARALDVAHGAGVVHRDLKPENIFLCRREDGALLVKILDFGLSKIRGAATAITHEVAILGTPDFMAPEQAVGRTEDIDARSDIFALGGVAYYALTARRPFEASSVPALLRRICDEEPLEVGRARPGLPDGVADVLAIAMAKRRSERYQSASELARDLRAALAGTPSAGVAERARTVHRGQPSSTSSAGDPGINPTGETQPAIGVDG